MKGKCQDLANRLERCGENAHHHALIRPLVVGESHAAGGSMKWGRAKQVKSQHLVYGTVEATYGTQARRKEGRCWSKNTQLILALYCPELCREKGINWAQRQSPALGTPLGQQRKRLMQQDPRPPKRTPLRKGTWAGSQGQRICGYLLMEQPATKLQRKMQELECGRGSSPGLSSAGQEVSEGGKRPSHFL